VPLSSRSAAFAAVLVALVAAPAAAQSRRQLDPSDPQAQLLGYYAAAVSFSPVGLLQPGFSVGGAVGMIPALSAEEQRVGFGGTKSEDTNRCSVYPRLVGSWMSRRGFAVEAGYTPGAGACGVTASVVSAAVSYRFQASPTWDAVARLALSGGSIEGDFTCSAAAVANAADLTCYGGTPSADKMAPGGYALDLALAHRGPFEPYVMAGFGRQGVDFDVNYTRTSAQGTAVGLPPLDDHERMHVTLTRVHAAAGAGWQVARFLRLGAEAYYEPSALLTARGSARVTFGGPR
jgi:opacity protein-like surface antigen